MPLQLLAAMGTELVGFADFAVTSWTLAVLHRVGRLVDEAGGDDAARDGDEGVAQEHDEGGEEAAQEGHGGDVTVAHGG